MVGGVADPPSKVVENLAMAAGAEVRAKDILGVCILL